MSNKPKIAISGRSGCGNTTVSKILAKTLGVELVNFTFRTLAEEKGLEFDQLRALAESDESFDREVDERQVALARDADGCVLGSRLAVWLLEEADLKVFLTGPAEVRAHRIARREGREYAEVLESTRIRDELDHRRYLSLYGIDNDQFEKVVDLIIDTRKFNQNDVANIILAALRRADLHNAWLVEKRD